MSIPPPPPALLEFHACSWMDSWTVAGVDDLDGTNQVLELYNSVKRGLKEQIPLSKTSSFFLHSLLVFVHILGQRPAFLHHLQKWQKMLQTVMHMTIYFKCLDPIFSSVYPATDIKSEPVVLKRNALKTAKKASYKLNSLPLITRIKAFYSP